MAQLEGSDELDLGLEDEASDFSDDDEDEDNPRPGIQEIVVLDGRDEGPDDHDKPQT